MTTLADLTAGQQFLMACQVVSIDPTTGMTLSLFGPASAEAATAIIAPTGAMTGQLLTTPDQVPVSVVTGLALLSVGDLLSNDVTGETMVCRWSQISPDGNSVWSSAPDHKVVYATSGWTVIGHCNLT
jgi:hypothetical protein